MSISDDGRFLRCQGMIVDEIEDFVPSIHEMIINEVPEFQTGPIPSGPTGIAWDPCLQRSRRRFIRWLWACCDLVYDSKASGFDKVSRKKAFLYTLLCDQGIGAGGQVPGEIISAILEYMEVFQDYTSRSGEILDENSQEKPRVPKSLFAFDNAVVFLCGMRNFSVTTGGRLGQMPVGTERGDLVCVLIGGEVPFVLRPTFHGSNSYRLIGECFLNGVMNGEMLEGNEHATREILLV